MSRLSARAPSESNGRRAARVTCASLGVRVRACAMQLLSSACDERSRLSDTVGHCARAFGRRMLNLVDGSTQMLRERRASTCCIEVTTKAKKNLTLYNSCSVSRKEAARKRPPHSQAQMIVVLCRLLKWLSITGFPPMGASRRRSQKLLSKSTAPGGTLKRTTLKA